jgi:N-acetylmuramoyl-L-alanine amidase
MSTYQMAAAPVVPLRIIGPPIATIDKVLSNLTAMGAASLFINSMLIPLWDEALAAAVDPVGMVAQSYKETAGGKFGGAVTAQFYNTAGIKVRHLGKFPGVDDGDRPLAHAQFASWNIGARAHAQHARGYANCPVPDAEVVDPRYWLVIGRHNCVNWSDLGGKWAPSLTYGQEIESIARRLQA